MEQVHSTHDTLATALQHFVLASGQALHIGSNLVVKDTQQAGSDVKDHNHATEALGDNSLYHRHGCKSVHNAVLPAFHTGSILQAFFLEAHHNFLPSNLSRHLEAREDEHIHRDRYIHARLLGDNACAYVCTHTGSLRSESYDVICDGLCGGVHMP